MRGALFSAGLLLAASSVLAAPISYTSQYIPTDLPSTSGGTVANPSWFLGTAGTFSANATGGVLNANTMPDAGNQQYWEISSTSGTSAAWNLDSTVGATIDFTIAIQQSLNYGGGSPQILGGFNISVSDNMYSASLFFSLDQISLWGSTIVYNTYDLTVAHTFRVVFKDGLISLYEGSNAAPVFDNIAMAKTSYQSIYWGDGSGGASGQYQLSHLGWNNTLADFSAPIPEPAVSGLALLGGLALLWRRRSKV